jgi:SnoaL-like domain
VCIDHDEIRRLSYTYTFLLDAGDFDGVAHLLGGGVLRPVMRGIGSDGIAGHEAIKAFYADQVVLYDGDPRTRHIVSNHVITVDGDEAGGHSYFTVYIKPPGLPLQVVVLGQYRDRFARAGGCWTFAEKAIQVDYLGEIGLHFKIAEAHSA